MFYATAIVAMMFQFLNGTIKSDELKKAPVRDPKFQFLNGTIKSSVCCAQTLQVSSVSIPKWYN